MSYGPQDDVAECTMMHPARLFCGFFCAQIQKAEHRPTRSSYPRKGAKMPTKTTINPQLAALKLIQALFDSGWINAETYSNVLARYQVVK